MLIIKYNVTIWIIHYMLNMGVLKKYKNSFEINYKFYNDVDISIRFLYFLARIKWLTSLEIGGKSNAIFIFYFYDKINNTTVIVNEIME